MYNYNKPRIGQELLDVPMGDMIRQMAFAIAEAQIRLDENSIDVAEMMGGLRTITDDFGNVTFEDSRVFFGNEKISKADAAERHNSTSDVQLKAEIRAALGNSNYTPVLDTSAFNPEEHTVDEGEYYDVDGTFWVYTASGNKQISYSDLTISLTEPESGAGIIQIPRRLSMMELGFTPTFYQFVDTIIEVKIAIKYTQEGSSSLSVTNNNKSTSASLGFGFSKVKAGTNVNTSQVNASYSQKYSYSAEGSSLLRTKLVPTPAPAILEERIRAIMEQEQQNTENSGS